MNKQVISSQRSAKEAVDDMAKQNVKLVQAYLEKKKEVKLVLRPHRQKSEVRMKSCRHAESWMVCCRL